jgi:hypothetical protein
MLSRFNILRDAAEHKGTIPRFVIPGIQHFLDHADDCRLPLVSEDNLFDAVRHMMVHGMCACWAEGRDVWSEQSPHRASYLEARNGDDIMALCVYGDALCTVYRAELRGISCSNTAIASAVLDFISHGPSDSVECTTDDPNYRTVHAYVTYNRDLWPLPEGAGEWATAVGYFGQDEAGELLWGQSDLGTQVLDMLLQALQGAGGSLLLFFGQDRHRPFEGGFVVEPGGSIQSAPAEMLADPAAFGIRLPAPVCDPCRVG